ncbi:MAG: glycosyltransferase [Bacteroidales bacterium]|nr:glycosyltransferase [Bacteroidales bacterium]
MKKKLLVILPRIPYPLEKGDKLRAFYQIKELSKNWDIILCALNDQKTHPDAFNILKPFCSQLFFFKIPKYAILINLFLNILSKKPFQVAYFLHEPIKKKIHKLFYSEKPDFIYCQLIRTACYAFDLPARKIIDFQDCFSTNIERRKSVSPWYLRPLLSIEQQRVFRFESFVFDNFNGHTIIAEPDREKTPVQNKNNIAIVPNGVNFEYFSPDSTMQKKDFVLFTGNMNYPPNVKSAEFLAKEIMPLVWKEKPNFKLVLAGANPAAKVKNLASDSVVVTGWVDDMRLYYNESRIFIAPMQIGTGLQNKLLEAMAMNLPCITSPLANQPLGAIHEKHILIGNSALEYAHQIVSLINNPDWANSIANEGYMFVKQNFDWEAMNRKLEKVILNV